MSELFDLEALDDTEPFEIDEQAAHLFKHPHLGLDDVIDAWSIIRCSTRPSRPPTG